MKASKGIFQAVVCANISLAERFYRLTLELTGKGAEAFKSVIPGQFIEMDLSDLAVPDKSAFGQALAESSGRNIILRRPFSFRDVRIREGNKVRVEILFCVLGPATLRMTTLSEGDIVSIIGPLGNGFSVPEEKKVVLLIAGGMGAPPLQHLAAYLKARHSNMRVVAFAGAQTYSALPFTLLIDNEEGLFIHEFSRLRVESHIATDDGSAGFRGFVTDCVEKWLADYNPAPEDIVICSCGPKPMLASVAKLAHKHKIDCQVSMESMMACGIGLCQSCVVPVKQEDGEEIYRLCCKDGPIFDSKDIIFE